MRLALGTVRVLLECSPQCGVAGLTLLACMVEWHNLLVRSAASDRVKTMDYRLDLGTLLLMLGRSDGSLDTDLLNMQGIKGRCRVHVSLENGHVYMCTIIDANGMVKYAGEVALKLVQDRVLEWHYTEGPRTPATPSSVVALQRPPESSLSIPHRTSSGMPDDFLTWPRLYRHIYSLTNGVASVEQIIKIVARGQDPKVVRDAFSALLRAGFIVLKEDTQGNHSN